MSDLDIEIAIRIATFESRLPRGAKDAILHLFVFSRIIRTKIRHASSLIARKNEREIYLRRISILLRLVVEVDRNIGRREVDCDRIPVFFVKNGKERSRDTVARDAETCIRNIVSKSCV